MGQKHTLMKNEESSNYSDSKPSQILHLEYALDQINSQTFIKPSMQLSSVYQLLIQSNIQPKYTYGLKFNKNYLPESQTLNHEFFNFPVQIYFLEKNQQQKSFLIFDGQLFKGKRNKYGTQYNKDQTIFYQGHFKNNKYHGWGITTEYQGEWANGLKCGYGKFKSNPTKNNIKVAYEGFWKNNKFDGMGIKNIAFYESKAFIDQNYQPCSIQYDEQYVGEWLQGMKFGCGKLIKYIRKGQQTNTEIYEGEFVKDLYHGKGKLKLNSSNYQQGTFQHGKIVNNNKI